MTRLKASAATLLALCGCNASSPGSEGAPRDTRGKRKEEQPAPTPNGKAPEGITPSTETAPASRYPNAQRQVGVGFEHPFWLAPYCKTLPWENPESAVAALAEATRDRAAPGTRRIQLGSYPPLRTKAAGVSIDVDGRRYLAPYKNGGMASFDVPVSKTAPVQFWFADGAPILVDVRGGRHPMSLVVGRHADGKDRPFAEELYSASSPEVERRRAPTIRFKGPIAAERRVMVVTQSNEVEQQLHETEFTMEHIVLAENEVSEAGILGAIEPNQHSFMLDGCHLKVVQRWGTAWTISFPTPGGPPRIDVTAVGE